MDDAIASHDRSELLAYVERHWRELTLSQARSFGVDHIDGIVPAVPIINRSLTYR